MKKISIFILIAGAMLLLSSCKTANVYHTKNLYEKGDETGNTLLICKIAHNFSVDLEFTLTSINTNRKREYDFEFKIEPKKDDYIYIFYNMDEDKTFNYHILEKFYASQTIWKNNLKYNRTTQGDLLPFKNNRIVLAKKGDIKYMGKYSVIFNEKKGTFMFIYDSSDKKDYKNALKNVIQKYKGTKFEAIAMQKLNKMKKVAKK